MFDALASVTYVQPRSTKRWYAHMTITASLKLQELLTVAHFRNLGLAFTDDGITVET